MNWNKAFAERAEYLPTLTIGKFLKIAVEDKSVISLGPGEPDFTTPKPILDYAKKMIDKNTHYSPVAGRSETKEAFADYLKKNNKIKVDPEKEVMITAGSQEALMLGLMCVVDPGEEVLVPNPGFLAYVPGCYMINASPVSIPLRYENGFAMDLDEVRKSITVKTRAIILNTPSNPTGVVYSRSLLKELLEIAKENDLLIISDEAYERLVYGKAKHVSIGSLPGAKENVLTLHSVSKTYAMAGFRVGLAAGPEKIIDAMTKLHISTSLSAATISQIAVAHALSKGYSNEIEKMRKEYDRRRKLIVGRLAEIDGFDLHEPQGAFYAFPKINFKMKSYDFSMWLLKNAKVACIPGTEFGSYGEGFVRFSYATEYSLIEKALDKIESATKKLKK
ncbi:MAG: pyridoxal phosphate-dependent aminotransferase [Candidatus Diapherotrites archaeon]|nr:pyridoxal phosphate-dependent aminotransferase [Candidatus Diapherotrites archaeon]